VLPFESWAQELTGSILVYPVMVGLSALDAFTIVLPSESVLAMLASTSISLGSPNLALLIITAAMGAHAGDVALFGLGRAFRLTPMVSRPSRFTRALDWTRERLDRQGPLVIVTARYIPYGRLLVNFTAGSSGYSARRFIALSALGCVVWAIAYAGIGAGIGAWLGDRWWLALVAAIAIALVVGLVVDRAMKRWGPSA
jgi:membrane protein DedA with SNARE-associated domain